MMEPQNKYDTTGPVTLLPKRKGYTLEEQVDNLIRCTFYLKTRMDRMDETFEKIFEHLREKP